jgi:hypothetical protein
MIEPWFIAQNWAWVPGTALGTFGGLWGAAIGSLAPRCRAKGFVLGSGIAMILICFASLVLGVVALVVKQPFSVWFTLLLPGALGVMIFGMLLPMAWYAYRVAEGRKVKAADLWLS